MPPKTILLAMLNESGHLNPTFKLSKALKARGHDVRYLAMLDLAPRLEAEGFAVEPLFADLFPVGCLEAERARGLLARRRAITERYQQLIARLLATGPDGLASVRPDLLLVDVTQVQVALWARRHGLPLLHLNTSLPQTEDAGVPPLRSGAPYGADLIGRARAALAWRRFLLQRRLGAELSAPLGMCPPYALAVREAARFSVRPAELDAHTVYMPQLRGVPELVLCPEALDFPRPARATRTYVESIDLSRREPALALTPDARPLFYAALGGQVYRAGDVPAFFARLCEVFRARPDWRLLLAVGAHMAPDALAAPANVTVVVRAPQLTVLREARVMVTHGGLGSVKECVMHGVPMLGVPLDVDQPGNVARVVHHGLGLAADVRRSAPHALAQALGRLLDEPAFRVRAAAMRARFLESEAGTRGVSAVEQALG